MLILHENKRDVDKDYVPSEFSVNVKYFGRFGIGKLRKKKEKKKNMQKVLFKRKHEYEYIDILIADFTYLQMQCIVYTELNKNRHIKVHCSI